MQTAALFQRLHIHKTLTDELNIECIVNTFASANDTRKDMFGS